jgi:hypothetical protein
MSTDDTSRSTDDEPPAPPAPTGTSTGESNGRRRLRLIRENWYRDLWLVVLTIIMLVALGAALNAIDSIQEERAAAIRRACDEQNARNATALRYLRGLTAEQDQDRDEPRRTPAEQAKLVQDFTDALVGPVRDCDEVVQRTVSKPPT